MRSFDWLIYVGALGLMLAVIFALSPNADAPALAPALEFAQEFAEEMGPLLPDPSPLDEMVLVQVGEPQNGIGTAFALNEEGDWLTARHVVEGCAEVTLEVAPGNYVPVAAISWATNMRQVPTSENSLLSSHRPLAPSVVRSASTSRYSPT